MTPQPKTSPSNYVEVLYFDGWQFTERKLAYYTPGECSVIFDKTVKKYDGQSQHVLICHRDGNHVLVRAWRNFEEKPKRSAKRGDNLPF